MSQILQPPPAAGRRSHPARIAITGFGSINALGAGVAAFDRGLRDGRCGIGELSLFPAAGFRSSRAAEVAEFALPAGVPRPIARRASRTARLALVAAAEACAMARLDPSDAAAIGVVLGTTTGGMATGEECYRRTRTGVPGRLPLAAWLETPIAVVTDEVAATFAGNGPRLTVSTACSSSANALGIAADWIRAGRVEAVLCGGADSLCQMTFSGFNALQALDREPCRPFDRSQHGWPGGGLRWSWRRAGTEP